MIMIVNGNVAVASTLSVYYTRNLLFFIIFPSIFLYNFDHLLPVIKLHTYINPHIFNFQTCDRENRPIGIRGIWVRESATHVVGRLRVTQRPVRVTPQQSTPAAPASSPSAYVPSPAPSRPGRLGRQHSASWHAAQ